MPWMLLLLPRRADAAAATAPADGNGGAGAVGVAGAKDSAATAPASLAVAAEHAAGLPSTTSPAQPAACSPPAMVFRFNGPGEGRAFQSLLHAASRAREVLMQRAVDAATAAASAATAAAAAAVAARAPAAEAAALAQEQRQEAASGGNCAVEAVGPGGGGAGAGGAGAATADDMAAQAAGMSRQDIQAAIEVCACLRGAGAACTEAKSAVQVIYFTVTSFNTATGSRKRCR